MKVNSAEVRRNLDMARIIKDIAALCDVEFEGDNVMEEKVILASIITQLVVYRLYLVMDGAYPLLHYHLK